MTCGLASPRSSIGPIAAPQLRSSAITTRSGCWAWSTWPNSDSSGGRPGCAETSSTSAWTVPTTSTNPLLARVNSAAASSAESSVPTIITRRTAREPGSTSSHQSFETTKTPAASSRRGAGLAEPNGASHGCSAETRTSPNAVPVAAANREPKTSGRPRRALLRQTTQATVDIETTSTACPPPRWSPRKRVTQITAARPAVDRTGLSTPVAEACARPERFGRTTTPDGREGDTLDTGAQHSEPGLPQYVGNSPLLPPTSLIPEEQMPNLTRPKCTFRR